jgi:predicted amidohydrolase YtcJ
LIPAVGSGRIGYLFPFRTLTQAGADVLFSTDWPAVPLLKPMITMSVGINVEIRRN